MTAPPMQIVPIAASVDMNSVMGVVILIAAYGFGRGACACVVVCMRATCMLRRKGGCMRMMMMVLVLSTLVLFSTLDINFMYACMRLMLLAHIKSVAISGVQDELSLRIGIMRCSRKKWRCLFQCNC